MGEKRFGRFYKIVRQLVRMVLPKYSNKNIAPTSKPTVYISRHQNMSGPVSILAWSNHFMHTWVFAPFLSQKSCYQHYVDYTFTQRFGWPKILAKIIAWPTSYFVSALLNSGRMLPVYRKSRKIIQTFKLSLNALLRNEDLLIFPEIDYTNTDISTSKIYEGFLHLEKYYYRETKKHLAFVPIYSDKERREIRRGKAIYFTGKKKFIEERKEIVQEIQKELNRLAGM